MKLRIRRTGAPARSTTPDPPEAQSVEANGRMKKANELVINPRTGKPYSNPNKLKGDEIAKSMEYQLREAQKQVKQFGLPNSIFVEDLTEMTIVGQKVLSPDEAKDIKQKALTQFEEAVRTVTGNGMFMLQKLLELANGIQCVKKNARGEEEVVYTRPPDFFAIKLLTGYGFGAPTGEEKHAEASGGSGNVTQVNVYIPDNGRGDGPAPVDKVVLPAKFLPDNGRDTEIIDTEAIDKDN